MGGKLNGWGSSISSIGVGQFYYCCGAVLYCSVAVLPVLLEWDSSIAMGQFHIGVRGNLMGGAVVAKLVTGTLV